MNFIVHRYILRTVTERLQMADHYLNKKKTNVSDLQNLSYSLQVQSEAWGLVS